MLSDFDQHQRALHDFMSSLSDQDMISALAVLPERTLVEVVAVIDRDRNAIVGPLKRRPPFKAGQVAHLHQIC